MRDIDKVIKVAQEAVPPQTLVVDGITYTPKTLTAVAPPLADPIQASNSLQAVVDYVQENPDAHGTGAMFIHVVDYRTVRVLGVPQEPTKQRPVFLTCTASERWNRMYKTNSLLLSRDFIIWMMSGFSPQGDHEYALSLAASLKAEAVTDITDNSVSQAVAVKRGVKSELQEIRNPPTPWTDDCSQGDKYDGCFTAQTQEDADIQLLMCVGHTLRYGKRYDSEAMCWRKLTWAEAFWRERDNIAWMAFAKDVGCGDILQRELVDGQYVTVQRTKYRDHVQQLFKARLPAGIIGGANPDNTATRVAAKRSKNAKNAGVVNWERNHPPHSQAQATLF